MAAVMAVGALVSGCASLSGGPPRLYPVEEEVQAIKNNLKDFGMPLADFSRLDEASRQKYRNDWVAARMYVIDLEYTGYEAALTKERQNVGFGAAATTIGLTTASGLATSTMSKDILTGVAGAITGARAAYENDILFAHSVQWIQSQMRTQRALIAGRILRGMKLSTTDYPLAAALLDLEDYYRAGTFTGGMVATTETLGAAAQLAAISRGAVYIGTYGPDKSSETIQKYITSGGKPNVPHILQLNKLLLEMGYQMDVRTIVDAREAAPIRQQLIDYARSKKIDLTK